MEVFWMSLDGVFGTCVDPVGFNTGACEIKAILSNRCAASAIPTLFQCWRACLCECKVVRSKSRVLREDGAEQGNTEIGETGFPRKPERVNLFERLLFRKHRYLAVSRLRIVVKTRLNRARIVRNPCAPVCGYRAGYLGLGLALL